MKTIRTSIVIAILILVGIALNSCEKRNTSNDGQPTSELAESQNEDSQIDSNEEKQALDSINALNSQIDILAKNQETNNDRLNNVSNEIADMNRVSRLFDLISWVIAVIALLVGVFTVIKLISFQKRADRHRNELDDLELRINSLELKTTSASSRVNSANTGTTNSEYSSLASRLNYIERQLEKIIRSQTIDNHKVVQDRAASEIRQLTNEQNGYFGLPKQMSFTKAYFKDFSYIQDSDSRFFVSIKDDKAEFRPIDGTQYLNDLKSNDDIKMALDIQGCAPSEANQMTVILPGEAKQNGDRWIITKKATIALSQ